MKKVISNIQKYLIKERRKKCLSLEKKKKRFWTNFFLKNLQQKLSLFLLSVTDDSVKRHIWKSNDINI